MKTFATIWFLFIMSGQAQTNLVLNPDFSQGDGFPAHWKFETGAPETFEVRRLDDRAGRGACMELRSLGADTSGYLTQVVQVEPRTWYRLAVWLRQRGGRGLLWVNARDAAHKPVAFDAREYIVSFLGHPLVPRFVPKEWMRGSDTDDWLEHGLEFFTLSNDPNAAPIAHAKINIGCYFSVSRLAISQVSLAKLDRPAPK